jgi:multidrug efflux pump subunit AcrA (membrane-fusion protein)
MNLLKIIKSTLCLSLASVVCVYASNLASKPKSNNAFTKKTFQIIKSGNHTPVIDLTGIINIAKSIQMVSATDAKVLSLKVEPNQFVLKGQVLFTLKNTDEPANKDNVKRKPKSKKKDQTRKQVLTTYLKKEKRISQQKENSLEKQNTRLIKLLSLEKSIKKEDTQRLKQEILKQKEAIATTQSEHIDAQNQIYRILKLLEKYSAEEDPSIQTFTAPFNAIVSAVHIKQGDTVNEHKPLLTLLEANTMEIHAPVPDLYATTIEKAILDKKILIGEVFKNNNIYPLVLKTFIYTKQKGKKQRIAIFNLPPKDFPEKIGESVELKLFLPSCEKCFAIPQHALWKNNSAVYQLKNKTLSLVHITYLGETDDGNAIVTSNQLNNNTIIYTSRKKPMRKVEVN